MERTVASNVRALRQAALDAGSAGGRSRFTVQALARELEIDDATYRGLESGRGAIGLDRMLQLARYLDVSPLDLVVPAPGVDEVLLEVAPRGASRPRTIEAVPVDLFVLWWRGVQPLKSQRRWRWRMRRGHRRSDPVFADARFADPQGRVEGRRRDGGRDVQEGKEVVTAPLEVPERLRVHMMLEKFWAACASGDDDDADWALEAIYEALQTGQRRAEGDPDPEAPMWGGRRMPMLAEEEIKDERED